MPPNFAHWLLEVDGDFPKTTKEIFENIPYSCLGTPPKVQERAFGRKKVPAAGLLGERREPSNVVCFGWNLRYKQILVRMFPNFDISFFTLDLFTKFQEVTI